MLSIVIIFLICTIAVAASMFLYYLYGEIKRLKYNLRDSEKNDLNQIFDGLNSLNERFYLLQEYLNIYIKEININTKTYAKREVADEVENAIQK